MINPDEIEFLQRGKSWPPKNHKDRLDRYESNKKLFLGKHDEVYLSHMMERMDVNFDTDMVQIAANFPSAVSKLYSDLLFGEEPQYSVGNNEEAQEWLDNFIESNKTKTKNYKAALSQSYRGDAVYKLLMENGKAKFQVVPAQYWFPVLDKSNINKIDAHVIAYTEKIDAREKKLHTEIHQAGRIDYKTYLLKNGKIKDLISSNSENTNVDRPLIFHVPNLQIDDNLFGIDDYSEADTLFAELDLRLSQISNILDKHSNPNMYGPQKNSTVDTMTGEEKVDIGGRYFEVAPDEEPPGYLTWDARLDANFEYIEKIMKMLYIVTDTNAAAFSLYESGSIPSGSAMRRLLMRSVARTSRKRLPFDDILPKLIKTANKLERENGIDTPELDNLNIEWNDGLPDDPAEQAEIMRKRTAEKATISQESAIKSLDNKIGEELEEEMQRIKEDSMRSAPPEVAPTVFGETEEKEEE